METPAFWNIFGWKILLKYSIYEANVIHSIPIKKTVVEETCFNSTVKSQARCPLNCQREPAVCRSPSRSFSNLPPLVFCRHIMASFHQSGNVEASKTMVAWFSGKFPWKMKSKAVFLEAPTPVAFIWTPGDISNQFLLWLRNSFLKALQWLEGL